MKHAGKLTVAQKILDRHPDVFGNLAQQYWREIASHMKGHGSAPALSMPKLLMRAALTGLLKPQGLQDRNHLARLQNWNATHLSNFDGLNPNKVRLNMRRPIAAQQPDNFFQVSVEFIQRGGLRMRAGKTRNVANEQTGIRATLDHGGIRFHKHAPLDADEGNSSSLVRTGCRGQRILGLEVYRKVSDGR